MDALMLSRIQFGANITFHILFPTITIALCWVLLFFKLRFDASGDQKWIDAYRFWVKVFALCFALGVVSRRHHVLPVRHQLAGLHGACRQYRRAAARL